MELQLSDADQRLYTKIYASMSDLAFARNCAAHLLKEVSNKRPWGRGNVYFRQAVFVTSMIVSYARPFTPGRGGPAFPKKLINYNADEWALHDNLIERRHKVHAHSDPDLWRITPWRTGDVHIDLVGEPWLGIEPEELERLLGMTEKLGTAIQQRQKEILAKY
jgi:hypothetical protein